MRFVRQLSAHRLRDIALVGGKNASLGEMISKLEPVGVLTAAAYREHLAASELEGPIQELMRGVRKDEVHDLSRRSAEVRRVDPAAAAAAALTQRRRALVELGRWSVDCSCLGHDHDESRRRHRCRFKHVVDETAYRSRQYETTKCFVRHGARAPRIAVVRWVSCEQSCSYR